jgi:integrase
MRKVSVLNKLTMKEEKRFLFEVISSHNIRKTFIAALKRKKVQDSTIVSMSGHQPNTKALSRYYAVADDEKQDALDLI